MTEQELIDAISGHVSFGNMQPVMDAAKAYADAQVDAAVGRAMNEIGRISVEYNTQIAAKDTEIAELKARNERLREFVEFCKKSPEKLVTTHFFENGEFDYCDLVPLQDAAELALSPAPVTESPRPQQSDESGLLPYPFCGGKVEFYKNEDNEIGGWFHFGIWCHACRIGPSFSGNENPHANEILLKKWNKRA